MSAMRVPQSWSDVAIRRLLDTTSCPVCEVDALLDRHCRNCGADIPPDLATELWAASEAAAAALTARREVLERVPRPSRTTEAATTPTTGAQRMPGQPLDAGQHAPLNPPPATTPRSSATVQSVLAIAGAGLFAVAAIVFTFFNPDLTDRVLRSVIVGIITTLFLAGAWALARRRLQFSAEAVGALGMVFVALDVYAISELTPAGLSPWAFAAIGTLVSGAVMVAAASAARIRSWLWISFLGLAIVPAMLGYAGGTDLSALLGHLGTAFAALGLIDASRALTRRFGEQIRSERVTLTVVQIIAVVVVLAQMWFVNAGSAAEHWLTIAAVLAAVTVLAGLATRHLARGFWSMIVGAAGVATLVALPFTLDLGAHGAEQWYHAITPATGAAALLTLGGLTPLPRTVGRRAFLGGAFALTFASVISPVLLAVMIGGVTVLGAFAGFDLAESIVGADSVLAVGIGLAAMAAGLGAFTAVTTRGGMAQGDAARLRLARGTRAIAAWVASLAGLTFVCLPSLPLWSRITIALGMAVGASVALVAVPRIRASALGVRLPLVLGAHFAVLLATIISWVDDRVTVWAGIAIVVVIAVIARTVPAKLRFLHVGMGYAYALITFATALDHWGVGTIAMLCLTTSLGSIGAIGATFLRRVAPAAWHAVLVVTSVPFLIGVVQVIFERSGWTALSTGLIFLLALTLLSTRRAGLGVALRAIAAGLLVPSLAIVVVCLGAQVLLGSASPITLPVIATIVALVLPSSGLIGSALAKQGLGERDATAARMAIEASTLLTGAISVALALARVAAGLPTTFIVLVVLGLGAAATSFWAKRRYGWWVAGVSFTGALWCLWAIAGIGVLEPYLLPPTLAAAITGMVLTARGFRGAPLYATGLIVAVAPILVVLAVSGTGAAAASWRGYGLVAASWLLLGLGALLGRDSPARAGSLRALRVSTLCVAIAAGAAGAIQGVRFGLGADAITTGGAPLVLLCFGIGMAGALPAAAAARAIRSTAPAESRLARNRWLSAPAVAYLGAATWTAIEHDRFTIWAMWALMLGYLIAVVVIAWRLRARSTSLPPVWFVFLLALVTSIVAWSPRELRVESFSLPLGLFLLAAGALIAHAQRDDRQRDGTVNSWPAGWTGSWPLLAPGIVTMLLASVIATFTDPLTWRAILVIVIALGAILIGSRLKLAAPFLIGIIVLPIENAFVFLVQIGRGIESMPWWITLAVVGAVLLIIAVTYERRAGEENSITARLRDLN